MILEGRGKIIRALLGQACSELTLLRDPGTPEKRQGFYDRVKLTLDIWPYFYFNYRFAKRLPSVIGQLSQTKDPALFKSSLLELIQLHYLVSLMSFNTRDSKDGTIRKRLFSDMQYGYQCVMQAEGETPVEVLENAIHTMLYYDVIYAWTTKPLLGPINSYYSAKALLYEVKRQLERND